MASCVHPCVCAYVPVRDCVYKYVRLCMCVYVCVGVHIRMRFLGADAGADAAVGLFVNLSVHVCYC